MKRFRPIIIGTRASRLAMAQAAWVQKRIRSLYPQRDCVIKSIVTTGDRQHARRALLGKGIFVKEIEEALLAGDIDCAVHSMKDVPVERRRELVIAAVPARVDARDVLVCRQTHSLRTLPRGSRVGTSSMRRRAQLRVQRPDVLVHDVQGNIDTRLRKLREGRFDALVLAAAGLIRLGLKDRITDVLPVTAMVPAPGQGALGVQVRARDRFLRSLVRALDHTPTRYAVAAERAFLAALGGGCNIPAGAYAVVRGSRICIRGVMFAQGEETARRGSISGDARSPVAVGKKLFAQLVRGGC